MPRRKKRVREIVEDIKQVLKKGLNSEELGKDLEKIKKKYAK